jgi:hypothetical protein
MLKVITAFAYIEGAAAELVPTDLRSALYTLASDRRARQIPTKAVTPLRAIVNVAHRQIDLAGTAEGADMALAGDIRARLRDQAVDLARGDLAPLLEAAAARRGFSTPLAQPQLSPTQKNGVP